MLFMKDFDKTGAKGKKFPDLKAGDTVRVHQKIKEGEKERIQIFEGMVISTQGAGDLDKTFTVRKTSFGIGVEKILPYNMPSITKIEVTKRGKTRRAKLYYLRDRQTKAAKLEEEKLTEEQLKELKYEIEESGKPEKKEVENTDTKDKPKTEVKKDAPKADAKKEIKPEAKKEDKPKDDKKSAENK